MNVAEHFAKRPRVKLAERQAAHGTLPPGGYDAPVARQSEDHLERWPFAQQIARLAMSAPPEWSVRIGVYGGWGEGKSTVLNFVASMAEENGHIVVRFNPWGCTTSEQLWHHFVACVLDALEREAEPELKKIAKRLRTSKSFVNISKVVSGLSEAHQVTKAGMAAGLPFLRDYLAQNRQKLLEAVGTPGQRRVVVLVDDLDRTNPTLLPQLLYALSELLGLGGFSFVLAIDPSRVGRVLQSVNPGWADGSDFLDKIVDFPRFLTLARRESLARLARTDLERYCPWLDMPAFESVLDLLPANPRLVRQFVRQISILQPVAERHGPHELVWPAVLLSQLIALRWPALADRLLLDKKKLADLLDDHEQFSDLSDVFEKDKERQPSKLEGTVDECAIEQGEDKGRAHEAVRRLGELSCRYPAEEVAGAALLAVEPPAATLKEFREFGAAVRAAGAQQATAEDWITGQAGRAESTRSRVYGDLYDKALQSYARHVQLSLDATDEEELQAHAERATGALAMVNLLAVDLGGSRGTPFALSSAQLVSLVRLARDRCKFSNHPAWAAHREAEADLIRRILAASDPDEVQALIDLEAGQVNGFDMDHHPEFASLYEEVTRTFAARLADRMLGEIEQGLFRLWGDGGKPACIRQWVLLGRDSPFWDGRRRDAFFELARLAQSNRAVSSVMLELFRFLSYASGNDRDSVSLARAATALLQDGECTKAIWLAVSAFPRNPRVVGGLRNRHVPRVEMILGETLPKPAWWGGDPDEDPDAGVAVHQDGCVE